MLLSPPNNEGEQQHKILIPGLGGSKIYCHCDPDKPRRRLYPSKLAGIVDIDRHFYTCPNTSTKILKTLYGISVYRNFISRCKCASFSYNWSKPPIENAQLIIDYLRTSFGPEKTFCLIGHSVGGLLIRIILEHLKPIDIVARVRRVYICGTPLFGSTDTNEYNCELQILPVLNQTKAHMKLQKRPATVTKADIRRFLKHCRLTMMYMAPSFSIDNMPLVADKEIIQLRNVHRDLGYFEFPTNCRYFFFYNISREIIIKHRMDDDALRHISRKDCETHVLDMRYLAAEKVWLLKRKFQSDGLVIPCRNFPTNADVFFDTTFMTHALLMNSPELISIITSKKKIGL